MDVITHPEAMQTYTILIALSSQRSSFQVPREEVQMYSCSLRSVNIPRVSTWVVGAVITELWHCSVLLFAYLDDWLIPLGLIHPSPSQCGGNDLFPQSFGLHNLLVQIASHPYSSTGSHCVHWCITINLMQCASAWNSRMVCSALGWPHLPFAL